MQVAIVKYNAGNVYSVVNALRRMGIEPMLTDDAETLRKADRVLFPGQGHAGEAMDYLRARRLDEVIRDLKQPVFGICVGQQLLCKHSEEGDTDCIGIFDAEVKRFQPQRHEDKSREVTSTSCTVTMYQCAQRPSRRQTISYPTLLRCTRTTSTPVSSIRRRAERWGNVFSGIF